MHLFLGILMLFFAACCYGLAWLFSSRKTGGYQTCDGKITGINGSTVTVTYTLDGKTYSAEINEEFRAKTDSLPPVGTEVSVSVSPENPAQPVHLGFMRQMGRGLGSERRYLDNSAKGNMKTMLLFGTGLLLCGIYHFFRLD